MVELSEVSYYRYCRITVCYLIGRRSGHQNMVELLPSVELGHFEIWLCLDKEQLEKKIEDMRKLRETLEQKVTDDSLNVAKTKAEEMENRTCRLEEKSLELRQGIERLQEKLVEEKEAHMKQIFQTIKHFALQHKWNMLNGNKNYIRRNNGNILQTQECSAFSEDTEVYSLSSEFEESVEDTFEDEFSDEEVDENQPSPWVRVYTPFSTSKTLTFGEVCGPQHLPPSIIRPIEYFLLFITINLMKEIVAFTNKCAQTLLASNRDKLPLFSRKLAWKDTTLDEMMAFIGVIFNMGNVKKNQIRDYWSKNELLETPWFGKVMSRGRFELLYSCFSLIDDSNLVPSSHPDYNPTARFEKLIEHVNNKFIYYYKPTQNLRVDESLVCLKNRTRLRQYMPQKHHGRFGVKLWMLCESKTGYCLRMKPYKGKLSPIIKALSYDVPMNLLQESSLLGKGYHLITDNFFTSINLAKDLLDSHTYLTGTIRTNRKGLPKTLKSAKLGVDESLYMVNNNLLALAYKEKKSKPPVKFLSTFCDASSGKKKVSDQRDYPQMKICYDSYMGGVDLNDQMLYTYMDERKGRKFYRKLRKKSAQLSRWRCHLRFNRICEDHQFIPPSLRIKDPVRNPFSEKITKKFQWDLLESRIQGCHSNIRIISKTVKGLIFHIRQLLPMAEFTEVIMSITRDIQLKEKILTGRQQTKMSYWVKKYQFPQSAAYPNNSSNGIVNLSSMPLTEKEERMLALGLHYVPPDKPDIPRLIAGVEGALKNLNHMETLRIRYAVTQVLRRPYHPVSYTRDHRSLIHKLKKTSSLVITKADKGNHTVLMDRADYEGKMMSILADTSTFTHIYLNICERRHGQVLQVIT
ncbi:ZKSCAN1 [Cordylochernes scorpioides]|uniref:ZKSCAN1 n=1 Tax=Cordylochernes scorpioides TaxID=51811 RepID=A0ABY6LQ31_9ARAC|nr:ZKSCAN1 [Cordylochernes scorpioides]